MRVNGEWLLCDDSVIRPSVQAAVRLADARWVEITLLLDAGADRTVLSADLFTLLQPLKCQEPDQIRLAGVGGAVSSITVETAIAFTRDDGQMATVRGPFAVFTEAESAELSVLGRDVTNNFSVIYDYSNRAVALLSPPHYYEIKKSS